VARLVVVEGVEDDAHHLEHAAHRASVECFAVHRLLELLKVDLAAPIGVGLLHGRL